MNWIPASHASVALDEEVRAAREDAWRKLDEARAARESGQTGTPSKRPVKPPRSAAPPRTGKRTQEAPRASGRSASPASRGDSEPTPSPARDEHPVYLTADELDYISAALDTHAKYRSIIDRRDAIT